jgi:Na+/proline symporter
VLAAAYTAYLIYGASITPSLLAAFLWKRATRQGAVASILAGAVVTLVWKFGLSPETMDGWNPIIKEATFPAAGSSVLTLVLVSLATPAPPKEAWSQFEQ